MTGHIVPTEVLSDDPAKRRAYADDVYYREAMVHVAQLSSSQIQFLLQCTSFALFKPEAMVGRRIGDALDYLRRHGFEPLGAFPVRFDRHTLRGMWWYQLNAAPLAVLRVVDMIIREADHLFVPLAESPGAPGTGSAARRLSDRKGSKRDTGTGRDLLREALGCKTQCINFVHVPDEPADLIRELGVLFDEAELPSVLAALVSQVADAHRLHELVVRSYAATPEHPLELPSSRARLCAAARDRAEAGAVLRALDDPAAQPDPLRLIEWLDRADIDLSRWDRIVIAAELASVQRAHKEPLIGPPPGERAQARQAEIAAARGRPRPAVVRERASAPAPLRGPGGDA